MKITSYLKKLMDVCSKKRAKTENYPEDVELEEIDINAFFEGRKKSKKQINKELIEKGFLKMNDEYKGCCHATQEEVEKEPRKYIIEECVEACKILWSKNIFTYMCSEFCDTKAWIELIESDLSEENINIINNLGEPYTVYKGYHNGSVMIQASCLGFEGQAQLIQFAEMLKMQDVPKREATITRINALIESGYSIKIKNPAYVSMEKFEEKTKDLDPTTRYQKLEEYFSSCENQEYIDDVDLDRIDRPVVDILSENGFVYVEEENKIYRSLFYYKKHLKYLSSQMKKEQSNKLS